VFPSLTRYDEDVLLKAVRHALRFTAAKTQLGYVSPARHFASPHRDLSLPPMSMRVRLKRSYGVDGFPQVQVILQARQTHALETRLIVSAGNARAGHSKFRRKAHGPRP
jgi:hypothetical protein